MGAGLIKTAKHRRIEDKATQECNWYHIFGLTDDIRVTAADIDLRITARHPHRSTCRRQHHV